MGEVIDLNAFAREPIDKVVDEHWQSLLLSLTQDTLGNDIGIAIKDMRSLLGSYAWAVMTHPDFPGTIFSRYGALTLAPNRHRDSITDEPRPVVPCRFMSWRKTSRGTMGINPPVLEAQHCKEVIAEFVIRVLRSHGIANTNAAPLTGMMILAVEGLIAAGYKFASGTMAIPSTPQEEGDALVFRVYKGSYAWRLKFEYLAMAADYQDFLTRSAEVPNG